MTTYNYPDYAPNNGYMTEQIRLQYINTAVTAKVLPTNAHRMADIISLSASNDIKKPIQFWQLYSVLGETRIIKLVKNFYERIFNEAHWFSSVFAGIGDLNHHVNTQSSMWIDVMGGGMVYHGGEFRLNFHHTHNAMQLMNDKGAKKWVELMVDTLNDPTIDITEDPRVRASLNTFLGHFLGKYAEEFEFTTNDSFGETNPALKRRINFLKLSSDQIEALSESDLRDELAARGIDVSVTTNKTELVNKALSL